VALGRRRGWRSPMIIVALVFAAALVMIVIAFVNNRRG
jgi:hypothetical protein